MKTWMIIAIVAIIAIIVVVFVAKSAAAKKAEDTSNNAVVAPPPSAVPSTMPGGETSPQFASNVLGNGISLNEQQKCINRCKLRHPFNKSKREECMASC